MSALYNGNNLGMVRGRLNLKKAKKEKKDQPKLPDQNERCEDISRGKTEESCLRNVLEGVKNDRARTEKIKPV